jgi:hypothetical protein
MILNRILLILIVPFLLGCSNPVEPTATLEIPIQRHTVPTFSESEAISQVWNHIRSEPPIEYVQKVQDYQAPTECDTYQGDDWVDKCIVAPLDAWFAAGEPYVDYLWREDVECFAWDRRYQFGTGGTMQRFTLSELPGWEAYFYNEADIVE